MIKCITFENYLVAVKVGVGIIMAGVALRVLTNSKATSESS